jgi:predicted GNAT family N-acyltransferase
MAVAEEVRGEGVGGRLLMGSLTRMALREPGIAKVWCNARERAVGLYERHGFVGVGEPFEVAEIGMHRRMERAMPAVIA